MVLLTDAGNLETLGVNAMFVDQAACLKVTHTPGLLIALRVGVVQFLYPALHGHVNTINHVGEVGDALGCEVG